MILQQLNSSNGLVLLPSIYFKHMKWEFEQQTHDLKINNDLSIIITEENRSSPPSKRLGVPLRRRRDASVFYWPFFSRKMKTHTATFFVLMMINFCGPPSSLPFGPKGKWTAKASWQQSVSVSPLLFEKPPERTAVFFPTKLWALKH